MSRHNHDRKDIKTVLGIENLALGGGIVKNIIEGVTSGISQGIGEASLRHYAGAFFHEFKHHHHKHKKKKHKEIPYGAPIFTPEEQARIDSGWKDFEAIRKNTDPQQEAEKIAESLAAVPKPGW